MRPGVTRLFFELPPATRLAWVSQAAERAWATRLRAVVAALEALELLSVAARLRPAALCAEEPERLVELGQRAAELGLVAHPFGRARRPLLGRVSAPLPERPGTLHVALVLVTRPEAFEELSRQLDGARGRATMVGAPPCCATFAERLESEGLRDSNWSTASSSPGVGLSVEGSFPIGTNTLLRAIGLAPSFHAPCSLDCQASLGAVASLLELGRERGFSQEMGWLEEILSWPMLWSALHGIAEVKTPVFRVVTTTDPTGEHLSILRRSEVYPAEGARGVTFPYRTPLVPLRYAR